MTQVQDLQALCCIAGTHGDVTVEELMLLARLADRLGLDRATFDWTVAKMHGDDEFRDEQIELVTRDIDGTMGRLVQVAREADPPLNQGHLAMVLWRVATKLDVSAEHFEKLFATSE